VSFSVTEEGKEEILGGMKIPGWEASAYIETEMTSVLTRAIEMGEGKD
jgi:hypothetical protein